jgi:hypothetical protein
MTTIINILENLVESLYESLDKDDKEVWSKTEEDWTDDEYIDYLQNIILSVKLEN